MEKVRDGSGEEKNKGDARECVFQRIVSEGCYGRNTEIRRNVGVEVETLGESGVLAERAADLRVVRGKVAAAVVLCGS